MSVTELLSEPSFEHRVRETAYFLWQQAGSPEGRDQEFWYKSLQQHARPQKWDDLPAAEGHDFLHTWDQ